MKKYVVLILVGTLNLLHASMHLLQFIQSMILIYNNPVTFGKNKMDHMDQNVSTIDSILHNPYINILWIFVAIFTLYLGVKDFLHHRKCKH